MNPKKANFYTLCSLSALILFHFLLFLKIPLIQTWFYQCAWWSYIVFMDSLVLRWKGQSLIVSRTKEFLWMIPLSYLFWLLFEAYNLRLHNWYYQGLPENTILRHIGFFTGFATVLPAVMETEEAIRVWKPFFRRTVKPVIWTATKLRLLLCSGIIASILPLVWPRLFFPLTWIGLILVLDPLNYRFQAKSILGELERGKLDTLLRLLLVGLILGGLWEFWNWKATTRWIYTVPYFNQLKIFEMPLTGFLGFPPFAVECWCFWQGAKKIARLR